MACCEYSCQPLMECNCEYKSISIETRPKILSLLASKSANLNHRAQCGMTPLMYASLRAPLLLHRLIKEGASIHLTDDFGFTALPYAKLGGSNDDLLCLYIHLFFYNIQWLNMFSCQVKYRTNAS